MIGVAARVGGGNLDPQAGDLAVTSGWGHAGKGGVTMPGKGKIILRPYSPDERAAVEQGAEALGLSAEEAFTQLGEQAVDVYLNDLAYWRCVPGVWSYTIGGYQVMKKWLSYRERPLLGRDTQAGGGARGHAHGPTDRGDLALAASARRQLPGGETEYVRVGGPWALRSQTWEIIDGKLQCCTSSLRDGGRTEPYDLEPWIESNPEILGPDIAIIGRQTTSKSGPIDLLGIDKTGNTVVVELKRDGPTAEGGTRPSHRLRIGCCGLGHRTSG